MFHDPYAAHVNAVDTLAAAGVAPPPEWTALRDRFANAVERASSTDTIGRVAAALINGDDADTVQNLWALATGQSGATSMDRAAVTNGVRAAVLHRLYALYAPAAESNWKAAADAFDKAAKAFTTAADTVNPESAATDVMGLSDKARKAWTDAEFLVHDIDAAIPALSAAVRLCGHPADGTAQSIIALTIDPAGHKRRAVWTAWENAENRCGRWSALHALGVPIRAARTPDDAVPYRAPYPIEQRQVPVGRGRWEWQTVDPEDEFDTAADTGADTPAEVTA